VGLGAGTDLIEARLCESAGSDGPYGISDNALVFGALVFGAPF